MLAELLDFEAADFLAGGIIDGLVRQVDFDLLACASNGRPLHSSEISSFNQMLFIVIILKSSL